MKNVISFSNFGKNEEEYAKQIETEEKQNIKLELLSKALEESGKTSEDFKKLVELEETLEITERYLALVEAIEETEKINQVISEDHSTLTQYNEGWQNATYRIKQAIENYIPQNIDKSKECIDRLTAAMEFLSDINNSEQTWLEISEIEWQTGNRYKDDCLGRIWRVNEDEKTLIEDDAEFSENIETIFHVRDIYVMRFKKILEGELDG